jgi:hypothetical protein
LFLGAIGWTINYRRTNGRFPNPIKTLKTIRRENPGFAGYQARMEYLLNHLLEFWTICVLLCVFLSFAGTGAIKDFVAFKIMANYVEHDSTLREKVGEVKYYGFWLTGGVSSNGEGDISFTIIGQNGTARARAVVSNVDGQSKVTTMTYK